jgi:hypothetical protein
LFSCATKHGNVIQAVRSWHRLNNYGAGPQLASDRGILHGRDNTQTGNELRPGQQDQPEHCFRDFLLRRNLLGHFADQSEAGAQAVIALCAVERFAQLRCAIWFGTFLPNWMLRRSLLSR